RGSNFNNDDLVLMYNHVTKPGTSKKLNQTSGETCPTRRTQPNTGPTNLINVVAYYPLNRTGQHGDLNKQINENQKLTLIEVTKVHPTQIDENDPINSSDQNSKLTLRWIMCPKIKSKLIVRQKIKKDDEINTLRKGKGIDKTNEKLIVDSHGDLSVSKPEQVPVPVVTANKALEVNQVGSTKNKNSNRNKIRNFNSILYPKFVTYGPGLQIN
ncbi:unnamed protein product, partial [Brachionus calyciflorus]